MKLTMRSVYDHLAIPKKEKCRESLTRGTSVYRLPSTVYRLLPTAYCLLPTAYCILVSSIMTMTLTNLVGVERATTRAYQRADCRAFLAAGDAANCRAAKRAASDC